MQVESNAENYFQPAFSIQLFDRSPVFNYFTVAQDELDCGYICKLLKSKYMYMSKLFFINTRIDSNEFFFSLHHVQYWF